VRKEIAMRFRLADHGEVFSTRPRGGVVLAQLEAGARGASTVEIDFEGVRSLSYSFADSFVGEAMQRARNGEYQFEIRLGKVPAQSRRVILSSLRNRGLDADPRDLFELAA
jgi:hypothetical protein